MKPKKPSSGRGCAVIVGILIFMAAGYGRADKSQMPADNIVMEFTLPAGESDIEALAPLPAVRAGKKRQPTRPAERNNAIRSFANTVQGAEAIPEPEAESWKEILPEKKVAEAYTTQDNISVFDDTVAQGAGTPWRSGTGEADTPYLIENALHLQYLITQTNSRLSNDSLRDKYFRLTTDIEIVSTVWIPIGAPGSCPFQGNFDGDGHTVGGVMNACGYDFFGFFGQICSANISNLHIKARINAQAIETDHIGGIAGAIRGSVEPFDPMQSLAAVPSKKKKGQCMRAITASVVLNRSCTINGCSMEGIIVFKRPDPDLLNVGGIVGGVINYPIVKIANCTNRAEIDIETSTYAHVGGIIGEANVFCSINSCCNAGRIALTSSYAGIDNSIVVGGITGHQGNVHACRNVSEQIQGELTHCENAVQLYVGRLTGDGFAYDCSSSVEVPDGKGGYLPYKGGDMEAKQLYICYESSD